MTPAEPSDLLSRDGPAVAGQARAVGSLLVLTGGPGRLPHAWSPPWSPPAGVRAALLQLAPGSVLATALAPTASALRRALDLALSTLSLS